MFTAIQVLLESKIVFLTLPTQVWIILLTGEEPWPSVLTESKRVTRLLPGEEWVVSSSRDRGGKLLRDSSV
jgi:hypothetical protein